MATAAWLGVLLEPDNGLGVTVGAGVVPGGTVVAEGRAGAEICDRGGLGFVLEDSEVLFELEPGSRSGLRVGLTCGGARSERGGSTTEPEVASGLELSGGMRAEAAFRARKGGTAVVVGVEPGCEEAGPELGAVVTVAASGRGPNVTLLEA